MRIIGYRKYSFTAEDGNPISGATFHCVTPIGKGGAGESPYTFSLSDAKIDKYIPVPLEDCLGLECEVFLNRYKKVAYIEFS